MAEVIFAITSAVKDVCGKPPTERLFLDKYGRICLCLDEVVWKVELELNFLATCYLYVAVNMDITIGYFLMRDIMLSISAGCLSNNIMLNCVCSAIFVPLIMHTIIP